ncbi:CamS family sex pheromone protein [Listeria sp. FSL L7-1485]|uniref:CamS family sex pheromone protein n=1 Tax=Listeria immobilis TaxID=2713502 RepID=A0A7X0X8E5_9LIST|nr:CamS family sex pheromone protein [Listeria immobilis]MBC1483401.1 CamS family sex pheromone protein [Listeria immobilis]MBC1489457.1 CamS family sex pheromone protein [Listeria immobilis]MBC1507617.1 CamS family sex pheromone protein [Listeria immobilis]MBC1510482.1 CamS family sex pheromone protein [Listeria immobilis]MBC1516728.1 CamS family sex pheromone protein [Listeria immobilis]
MKKIIIAMLGLTLILSGCAPKLDSNDKVVQKDDKKAETGIMTKNQISSDYYKTVLPYKASKSRGLVVSNIYSRYDINELESGLMRISQNEYSSDNYLFQEGQYLDKDTLQKWLDRKSKDNPNGLNPASNGNGKDRKPIYLAHILEQDYLKQTDKDSVSLGGISIALAMNSVDYYQKEQYGDTYEQPISDSVLLEQGKQMSATVLNRIRQTKGLENVPVTIAIYKQGERDAVAPGNFISYSTATGDTLSKWETVDEKNYVLPSTESAKDHKTDNDNFLNFKKSIEDYYPNFTGVVGRGRYEDGQLAELNIDIPLQFYGQAEIIGFTQYVTDLVGQHIPKTADLQVNINTTDGPAALITRKANEDAATAHIYD